ncbi:hypothetical protein Tco_0418743 [Tanacetum coccineum]
MLQSSSASSDGDADTDHGGGQVGSEATCRPGIPSTVALNCLTETMWARRCRPGMSPGKESHSSFSVPLIPGDMSPGERIPSDKSPGIPRICRWGVWQML